MSTSVLFYDGGCGLCHLSVRLLARIDRRDRLRYAPLGGETFRALVPVSERAALPDSLVLQTADGRRLVRSAAVFESLRLVGGAWAVFGRLGRLVPRRLGDRLYDALARVRHRLFGRPSESCPVRPGPLRSRFLP